MAKPTTQKGFLGLILRIGKFVLTQIGYECKSQTVTGSKNVAVWITLIFGSLAFVWSILALDNVDVHSILGNILATALLLLPTFIAHLTTIQDHYKSNVSVSGGTRLRNPDGNRLVIYGVIVAYTCLAFGCSIFLGDPALWLINFTACFIDLLSIIIDMFVVLFDAKIKID